MTNVFEGEKTSTFWIGLIIFGYSIFQFCQAVWQTFYYYLFYFDHVAVGAFGVSSDTRLFFALGQVVPSVIGGIVFAIIGLYIMKVGVKKQPQPQPAMPEEKPAEELQSSAL